MVSLALRAPRFDVGLVERLRGVAINRLKASRKNASFVAHDILRKAQYEGYPYRRPALGTMKTLAAIKLEAIKKYHPRLLVKDRVMVTVAGSIYPLKSWDLF